MPPEAILVDETRLRVPWPRTVRSPQQRLTWLLERFEAGPVPATPAARRRSRA